MKFTVSDTGIGIPKEKQADIFEAFSQADSSTTRRFGGTGLGLSISKQLVEMMDGQIGVESEVGQGSRFSFVVKMGVQEGSVGRVGAEDVLKVAHWGNKIQNGLHVLLAEDNAVNQRLVCRLLEKRGHSVRVVQNGKEALDALSDGAYDLVLMDVQMPEMDGFTVASRVRELEVGTGGHLPIVALTAYAMESDRERCLQAGMDAYVCKPVKADELFQTIENVLKDRKGNPL